MIKQKINKIEKIKKSKLFQRRLNFVRRSFFFIKDATLMLKSVYEGIILRSEIIVEISACNFGKVTINMNIRIKITHTMTALKMYSNIF